MKKLIYKCEDDLLTSVAFDHVFLILANKKAQKRYVRVVGYVGVFVYVSKYAYLKCTHTPNATTQNLLRAYVHVYVYKYVHVYVFHIFVYAHVCK